MVRDHLGYMGDCGQGLKSNHIITIGCVHVLYKDCFTPDRLLAL